MNDERTATWQKLFRRAMKVMDAAIAMGVPEDGWSFGGGTVLMLKYRHRFSRDIDIFFSDPQYVAAFSPRLNDRAEDGARGYDEQHLYVKLYFDEGEVDFVAAPPVTSDPFSHEEIMGRMVKVETPLEIVGKKIRFRADEFRARDLYDLALVLEKAPETAPELGQLLAEKREELKGRIARHAEPLREDFAAIDTLDYTPTFEHCLALLNRHL